MSWNECLHQYHKKYGGQLLAGECGDGLLLLSCKDRPLAVDLYQTSGRYGSANYVRARISVTLGKPYKLTIGEEKKLSGGVNAVLKATSGIAGFSADYGYPEVTQKRLIRSENQAFTKLVLSSLDFRNALPASPREKLTVRPGPGGEGLHLLTVITSDAVDGGGSDWYLWPDAFTDEAERLRRIETEFFPRLDRFLELTRAAYNAVTQWPM